MPTFASKHDFLVKKQGSATSPFCRWSVVSEIDFIQTIKITPGPT